MSKKKKESDPKPLVTPDKPLVNKHNKTNNLKRKAKQSRVGAPIRGAPNGRPKGRKANDTGVRVNLPGGGIMVYTDEVVDRYAQNLLDWLDESPDNIFICDWCEHAKLSYCAYDDWLDRKHPKFTQAYHAWKRKQGHKIYQGAINRKYDSGFSKFALCCNHGYKDPSTQVQISGDKDNPLTAILKIADGDSKKLVD